MKSLLRCGGTASAPADGGQAGTGELPVYRSPILRHGMSGWLSAPAERTAALITARNIGGVVDSLEIGVCVFADHDRAVADAPFWLRSADGHTALATGDLVASSSSPASLPVGERSSRRVSIEGANGFGDDGSRNAAVGCAVVCSARFVGCAVDGCDEVVVRDDHVFTREFRTALDGATLPEVDHPTVSLTSSWSAPQRRSEVHVNRMLRSPEPFRDPAILRTVLVHKMRSVTERSEHLRHRTARRSSIKL